MFPTKAFVGGLAVLCGLALAAVATGHSLGMAWGSFGFYSFHAVARSLCWGLVVPQRPDNAVGWVFVLVGLSSLLVVVSASFDSYRLAAWVEHCPPRPVRNHVANILAKLDVPDRAQAIAAARQAGLGYPTHRA